MKRICFFIAIAALIHLHSCKPDVPIITPIPSATPYLLEIPEGFPEQLNIPDENPITVEGVWLGRHLFYDGRLSGRTHPDSLMSCASCHIQSRGFSTGIDNARFPGGHPFGLTGIYTPHYTMPLVNLVFNSNGYLWNGMIHETNTFLYNNDPRYHRRNLESLVWMGIVAPHEMNGNIDRTVDLIASIPMYQQMFAAAFGTPEVTYERISFAIAQFVRTLISSDNKFDQYLRGEYQMTTSELNGFVLFVTEEGADCFHCHGGDGNPLFTTNLYYNNAKDSLFSDPRDRYAITGNPSDIGAYKAPTLRNIFSTAPYMHDGRFETIDEVINFYSHGLVWSPYVHPLMHKINEGGVQLLPSEKTDLKNFLLLLQDTTFLTNPKFSNPRPDDPFFQSDPFVENK